MKFFITLSCCLNGCAHFKRCFEIRRVFSLFYKNALNNIYHVFMLLNTGHYALKIFI